MSITKNLNKNVIQRGLFGFVILLSLALIVTGLIKHQNADVFNKAIRICLECIGIG